MELKNKKTILIFVDWYLPGYKAGGPIKSISSLVNYLKNDFNFLIITSDTDFGEEKSYDNIKSNEWINLDDAVSVFYASRSFLSGKNIKRLLKSVNFDLVYLNSFFSFYFSVLPLFFYKLGFIKVPILLAPRGMLGEGALKLKSQKKQVFVLISKISALHKNINWHATSEQEKNEVETVFGKNAAVSVVPNLQYNDLNKLVDIPFKRKGEVKLFFLSRISEKKNLLYALNVLAKLSSQIGSIEYNIIGPIEDDLYWAKCKDVIKRLPGNIKVSYEGAVQSFEVPKKISPYHFLFLPTFNENYGHAIVESYINGKPVIISDQTPWRELSDSSAGWDIELKNENEFIRVIEECVNMNNETYLKWSQSSIIYAKKKCLSVDSIEQTKKMFFNALSNE